MVIYLAQMQDIPTTYTSRPKLMGRGLVAEDHPYHASFDVPLRSISISLWD
jgi:hypothetical protein